MKRQEFMQNQMSAISHLRNETLEEFDKLKELKDKDSLGEDYLNYSLARDRKAGLIMKTVQIEIQTEVMKIRKGQNLNKGNDTE